MTQEQPINSSTVLAWLEGHYAEGSKGKVNVHDLALILNISITKLVSILTELEHRDEIKIDIEAQSDPASEEMKYSGTVQLMRTPPDELREPE